MKEKRNNREKRLGDYGASGKKDEAEHQDKLMRITTEDRSDLKGPAFYFVYADKVKSGNDDVDLHQEAIITNNHNFINSVVEITMYY